MMSKIIEQMREKGEVFLRVKVVPKSGEERVSEVMEDGTVKVKLKVAAEKGEANRALLKFLGKEFGGQVKIISGQTSRTKLVKIWI